MELTLTRQTPAQHIVWLDVVRLVAMFTVVCCHCTDPFNFYPGTSPDIVDIKFWELSTVRRSVLAYRFL